MTSALQMTMIPATGSLTTAPAPPTGRGPGRALRPGRPRHRRTRRGIGLPQVTAPPAMVWQTTLTVKTVPSIYRC